MLSTHRPIDLVTVAQRAPGETAQPAPPPSRSWRAAGEMLRARIGAGSPAVSLPHTMEEDIADHDRREVLFARPVQRRDAPRRRSSPRS